jgi:hypothetical protein
MPAEDVFGEPITFLLDLTPGATPEPMELKVFTDKKDISGLITDTHAWLCQYFLKGKRPTNKNLARLLGPDFRLVTLEFVYPIQDKYNKEVVVQLIRGTNVVTVRTFFPSGLFGLIESEVDPINEQISVTLFSDKDNDQNGLAYCHHHTNDNAGAGIARLLEDVASIMLDPHDHLAAMSARNDTIVARKTPAGAITTMAEGSIKVTFQPKSPSIAKTDVKGGGKTDDQSADPGSELRFICQRHLRRGKRAGVRNTSQTLLPCIKPSGTFHFGPDGVTVIVDTIVFVDYAADPSP